MGAGVDKNNITADEQDPFMTEEKKANETINIPFISYVEGSYFGDSDIFLPDTTRFERDSTAICARQESQFFVLAREVIV